MPDFAKRLITISLITFLLALSQSSLACTPYNEAHKPKDRFTPAKVLYVVDGDTIDVSIDGNRERVRLIGVDTPETKHPDKAVEAYGPEATRYTTRTLTGKTVFLETDVAERDKYDRILGYIWLSLPAGEKETKSEIRNELFNAKLLLDGYAQLMTIPPNIKYVEFFKIFQTEARLASRGLWNQVPNDSASKDNLETSTDTLVGSAKSSKYHFPDCDWAKKINPGNLLEFSGSEEARRQGYVPCKVCSPP